MRNIFRCVLYIVLATAGFGADKKTYHIAGIYTDTCSCRIPCTCDLTGDTPDSCLGVGAVDITHGDFPGAISRGCALRGQWTWANG
jgi:hypothetical protein